MDETLDFILRYRPSYVLASRYMESESAPSAAMVPKIPEVAALGRLSRVERVLTDAGIICNCDGGALSRERLQRLHTT